MFPPSLGHVIVIDGSSRCLLPGSVLGSHVYSSSFQKDNFFALIPVVLGSVCFSFNQTVCKCHPGVSRLIGMAAFKEEFPLNSVFLITSGCSCQLPNEALLLKCKGSNS